MLQKNKRKNKNNDALIRNQPPKTDIDNKKNSDRSTFLVGPSISGKIYLILKTLSRIINRDIHIITKSLPEHYSNSRIKNKEIEEIKPLNAYKNAIIVFDDILGSSKCR